jgi:co-chaperonin GroES (HSP10)
MKTYEAKPTGSTILVKVDSEDESIDLGNGTALVLPKDERHKKGSPTGTVVAIGRLAFSPPVGDGTPECEIGDKVVFKRYSGTDDSQLLGGLYRFIYDSDILAVLTDKKEK